MIRRGVSRITLITTIIVIVIIIAGAAYLLWPKGPAPVKEIKIGVSEPLTGPAADTGKLAVQGMEFAVDEINNAGGVKSLGGAKLKLVISDHGGDPKTGALETERLITEEKVVLMLGCYYSSVTKTASEVAERYKVPFLNPDSVSPGLTTRGFKWFFRATPYDVHLAKETFEFFNWINKQHPGLLKTIGILAEDSEWGSSWKDLIIKYAKSYGYPITVVVSFHTGATSLDTEVMKIKEANPDIVFEGAYTTDAILLMRTLKKLDYAPKLMIGEAGIEQQYLLDAVGKLAAYQFAITKHCPDLVEKIPKLKAKNEEFKAKYGKDMGEVAVRGYIGVYVAYTAIEEAGKTASPTNLEAFRTAIRNALVKIDIGKNVPWMIAPWDGVKFDEKGDNVRARGIIVQVMPDDIKHHTVWPRDLATREPIIPMPSWEERG